MDLKKLSNVAEIASQIMGEGLKGDQHKLDKNKNNKIDAEDLKILRKEEQEQIVEYESKNGRYIHKGTYGTEKSAEAGETNWDDEEKLAKKHLKDKPARKKYGARQNYVRSTRVNETFSSLLNTYKEGGLKALEEAYACKKKMVNEEPTNDEFTAELEKQKAKHAGTAKQAEVAKPAVVAVQQEETHTQVEVIDLDPINGVQTATIDLEERSLSEPEMNKREEIVKSMKKNMAGFKERYGERAKSVMYATATKQAKKD